MSQRFIVVALGLLWPFWAAARLPGQESVGRRTTSRDFAFQEVRRVLPNGLTVLLSPDPHANEVVVDLSFAAGTLYEPARMHGLAHLVEHLLAEGRSPGTRYRDLLDRRGATDFNGFTTFDRLSYRLVVPPEELPLALWVNADRLGTLPGELTEADLERARRVVLQERIQRVDDEPYSRSSEAMLARLFPEPNPLHSGVLGTPKSLATPKLADALDFARRLLVPANAILTITGRMDVGTANEWIDRTLGQLPAGRKADPPANESLANRGLTVAVSETFSRKPRVTLAWTLADPPQDTTLALTVGAVLLTVYTDGFVGMNVGASLSRYATDAVFTLDVTMPHAADRNEAAGNAEVVYRYLSRAVLPPDLAAMTFHALDRTQLARLSTPPSLANLILDRELHSPRVKSGFDALDAYWRLTPADIQALSAEALKGPRLTIEAQPVNPLPPRGLH